MSRRQDTPPGQAAASAEPAKPSELEQAHEEARQAKDQYLRAMADVENIKKRLQREKEASVLYAAESVIRELLPIVDSLDQALVIVDQQSDPDAVVKGVHLLHRQLLGLLDKQTVKRIPTVGERFDPHRHEAVGFADTDSAHPEGTIVEEVRAGYTLHGEILRPALVRVAKASPSPHTNQTSTQQP